MSGVQGWAAARLIWKDQTLQQKQTAPSEESNAIAKLAKQALDEREAERVRNYVRIAREEEERAAMLRKGDEKDDGATALHDELAVLKDALLASEEELHDQRELNRTLRGQVAHEAAKRQKEAAQHRATTLSLHSAAKRVRSAIAAARPAVASVRLAHAQLAAKRDSLRALASNVEKAWPELSRHVAVACRACKEVAEDNAELDRKLQASLSAEQGLRRERELLEAKVETLSNRSRDQAAALLEAEDAADAERTRADLAVTTQRAAADRAAHASADIARSKASLEARLHEEAQAASATIAALRESLASQAAGSAQRIEELEATVSRYREVERGYIHKITSLETVLEEEDGAASSSSPTASELAVRRRRRKKRYRRKKDRRGGDDPRAAGRRRPGGRPPKRAPYRPPSFGARLPPVVARIYAAAAGARLEFEGREERLAGALRAKLESLDEIVVFDAPRAAGHVASGIEFTDILRRRGDAQHVHESRPPHPR
ncbi:hypothetical protein DIPPA_08023 [Diplonema papillatum]|nr:hypothetical protein DIPPA_08023 [Diplonema papillatum]